jgi:hypothetical protein
MATVPRTRTDRPGTTPAITPGRPLPRTEYSIAGAAVEQGHFFNIFQLLANCAMNGMGGRNPAADAMR